MISRNMLLGVFGPGEIGPPEMGLGNEPHPRLGVSEALSQEAAPKLSAKTVSVNVNYVENHACAQNWVRMARVRILRFFNNRDVMKADHMA